MHNVGYWNWNLSLILFCLLALYVINSLCIKGLIEIIFHQTDADKNMYRSVNGKENIDEETQINNDILRENYSD